MAKCLSAIMSVMSPTPHAQSAQVTRRGSEHGLLVLCTPDRRDRNGSQLGPTGDEVGNEVEDNLGTFHGSLEAPACVMRPPFPHTRLLPVCGAASHADRHPPPVQFNTVKAGALQHRLIQNIPPVLLL
jgi:hypothetical protein